MFAFGIANHTPEAVFDFLLKSNSVASIQDVKVLECGRTLPEKRLKPQILFILNFTDFIKNCRLLNSDLYNDKQVFIFGSPMRVRELTHTLVLDVDFLSRDPFSHRAQPIQLLAYKAALKEKQREVKRNDHNYLQQIIEDVKSGSLLGPLMTFIYTLPSATLQGPVKEAVANWLYYGHSDNSLYTLLDEAGGGKLTHKIQQRLEDILLSPIGHAYQRAFSAVRKAQKSKQAVPLSDLITKYNVTDYELKYIQHVLESAKKKGDSRFNSARGRALTESYKS